MAYEKSMTYRRSVKQLFGLLKCPTKHKNVVQCLDLNPMMRYAQQNILLLGN